MILLADPQEQGGFATRHRTELANGDYGPGQPLLSHREPREVNRLSMFSPAVDGSKRRIEPEGARGAAMHTLWTALSAELRSKPHFRG